MKIFITVPLVLALLFLGNMTTQVGGLIAAEAQQEIPPYAKWGHVIMKETKQRYPNAKIIDYLHIGREKHDGFSTEKFKLWLKEADKEFGVFVDVTFDNQTKEIKDIQFRETTN